MDENADKHLPALAILSNGWLVATTQVLVKSTRPFPTLAYVSYIYFYFSCHSRDENLWVLLAFACVAAIAK